MAGVCPRSRTCSRKRRSRGRRAQSPPTRLTKSRSPPPRRLSPLSAAELRDHVANELLPLWAEHGVDPEDGGFHNRLGPDLQPAPDSAKRLLVQARQIYAFSATGERWALEVASRGFDFLKRRFLDPRYGGWFLSTEDRSKDLYAHAFALFALAHYHRASGESEARALAESTWEVLQEKLADPTHGGFFEGASEAWEVRVGPRRQNPHMHLLEALLALGWRAEADALVRLFHERFYDEKSGSLAELFDERWQPLATPEGRIVEPGHHFEWVWLLHGRSAAPGLFDFAYRHGVDADGGVFDQVDRDGEVVAATKRLWPQTERVKAHAVRGEIERMQQALDYCFAHYVDPGHRGWNEHLTRAGEVFSDCMNATSVYHVVLALGEAAEALD